MDHISTPVWLFIFTGLTGLSGGQQSGPQMFMGCLISGAIDNCMTSHLPQIHIGGRLADQTKRKLFMESLKLNKEEIEDICRYRRSYEEFLVCVSTLKRNCWLNSEVQNLFIEREQISRVLNYICQNYTYWNFICTSGQFFTVSNCERDYVRNRTEQRRRQNVMTTRGPITNDDSYERIRDECVYDWKNVTRKNQDISCLYIIYQMIMMASSIITPGTIFLLVTGATNIALPSIPLYGALILNIIPIAIFVLLVLFAKSETQLAYAGVLSAIYSLLMMLILVGLIRQAAEFGYCSVTTIFLTAVIAIFLMAAVLHPQEFTCILHGFLYFLSIPSMSMVLMIYSLGNLHVVSWGTRENKQAAPPAKPEDNKPTGSRVEGWWGKFIGSPDSRSGGRSLWLDSLFKCTCFSETVVKDDDSKLKVIMSRLDGIEQALTGGSVSRSESDRRSPGVTSRRRSRPVSVHFDDIQEDSTETQQPAVFQLTSAEPMWIDDSTLGNGQLDTLNTEEMTFWDELIEEYLYPIEENVEHKKAMQTELLELRNRTCLFFFLINGLFIILISTFQLVSESTPNLSINLPCATGDSNGQNFEPISFAFMFVFGVLLVIQFFGMFFHRLSTFLHIASLTKISDIRRAMKGKKSEKMLKNMTGEEAVQLVKDLQRPKEQEPEEVYTVLDSTETDNIIADRENNKWRRLVSRKIVANKMARAPVTNYDNVFIENFSDVTGVGRNGASSLQGPSRKTQKSGIYLNKVSVEALSKMASSTDKVKRSLARKATIMQTTRMKIDSASSDSGPPPGPAQRRIRRHRLEAGKVSGKYENIKEVPSH
ncbi:chitin synthase chs-2-like [Gigantopelta aegis]|uniref:chitin synthase chs-2-like n=1 Tax=Gigantopelta aegis TaxID=1735272 RepID=UPI001B88B6D7|nr:chitin synthase chs-2-like [Gigantopelta aegis]